MIQLFLLFEETINHLVIVGCAKEGHGVIIVINWDMLKTLLGKYMENQNIGSQILAIQNEKLGAMLLSEKPTTTYQKFVVHILTVLIVHVDDIVLTGHVLDKMINISSQRDLRSKTWKIQDTC